MKIIYGRVLKPNFAGVTSLLKSNIPYSYNRFKPLAKCMKYFSSRQANQDFNETDINIVVDLIKDNNNGNIHETKLIDWKKINSEISNVSLLSNKFKELWPNIFLRYLAHDRVDKQSFDLGMSLYDYISTTKLNKQNKMTILGAVIRLCGEYQSDQNENINKFHSEMLNLSDYFDSDTCQSLIVGLSSINQIKQAYSYLDMAKLTRSNLSQEFYSPIIKQLLRNKDEREINNVVKRMFRDGFQFNDKIVEYFIANGDRWLTKLLKYYSHFKWIPKHNEANLIQNAFKKQGKNVVKINRQKLKCTNCFKELNPIPRLSADEFEELKTSFLKLAIKRNDIFLTTTPQELEQFINFINNKGRFDMILDGLNVAYVCPKNFNLTKKANLLQDVVNHLVNEKKKRLLVLGRKHMLSWPSKQMKFIQKIADCYFVDNRSEDDKLMLYAALSSGQHTQIITIDELRDHKFLLGTELANKFKVWQRTSQVPFLGLKKNYNNELFLKFKYPDLYDTNIQYQNGTWHIPFCDGTEKPSYQLANCWFCVNN